MALSLSSGAGASRRRQSARSGVAGDGGAQRLERAAVRAAEKGLHSCVCVVDGEVDVWVWMVAVAVCGANWWLLELVML